MIELNLRTKEKLKGRFISYYRGNEDYWSFRGKAVREHAHAYLQYPAMMVPQMQRELIEIIRDFSPGIKSVYDPFVGSGTIMIESMLQGFDFCGQDINPLAVLICKTKIGPFFEKALSKKINNLFRNIDDDKSNNINLDFPNIFKWFKPEIAAELSQIRRSIKREPIKWSRRFFWVALAETVRLSSNSRTSTFKLHIRPPDEIENRVISPVKIFKKIVDDNYQKLSRIKKLLEKNGCLNKSRFNGSIEIILADSKKKLHENKNCKKKFDLLVTSPPYGDNATTVPYGQYSYLPLRWIDMPDICGSLDDSWLTTTHEIDNRSLGGIKIGALEESEEIKKISGTFSETIKNLQSEPPDRAMRVAAFCRDLDKCIDPILDVLNPGAHLILTIGNRRVGNKIVPMDNILVELLMARGVENVINFKRKIPSKRMAVKNNIADTMRMETILVFKKGNS